MQDRFRKDESSSDKFPNEAEATKLLSRVPSLIQGIELVIGRRVDSKEIVADEAFRELFDDSLNGEDRYALLLLKKATEQERSKGPAGI